MKLNPIILGIIGIVITLGIWMISGYNSLVAQKENVDASWAQVESQYQRRFDLIDNLVKSVKGTLTQEQEVFGKIAEARQGYAGTESREDKAVAAGDFESAISRLLVIMENYPTLQSNTAVMGLMDEITGTENRINVERQRYNDSVKTYNVKIKKIPTVFYAGILGFDEQEFFEAVAGSEIAPDVDLKLTK